jgi:hypothetical protein
MAQYQEKLMKIHLKHRYQYVEGHPVHHYEHNRKLPYKITTEVLVCCPCGKHKVFRLRGEWSDANLRKIYQ